MTNIQSSISTTIYLCILDNKISTQTSYFGWELTEYTDEYNKPRYYFTREIQNNLPDGLNRDS